MPSNFSENVKQTNVIASKFNDPPGNTRQTVNHTFCSCFSLLVWITLVFARRLSISLNNITDPDRLSPLKQRLRFCVRQLHFRSRIQLFSSLLILYSRFFISPFLFFKRKKNKIKFMRWKRERKTQKLPKKKKEFALSRYNIFIRDHDRPKRVKSFWNRETNIDIFSKIDVFRYFHQKRNLFMQLITTFLSL